MKLKLSFILLVAGFAMMSMTSKTCNKPVVLEFKAKMDPIFIDITDTTATTLTYAYAKSAILFKLDSTCKANSIPIDKIQSIKINSNKFTMVSIDGVAGGNFDFFQSVQSTIQANGQPSTRVYIGDFNPAIGNTWIDLNVDKTKDVLPIIKSENIDFGVIGTLRTLKIRPMRIQADLELNIGYKLN